jgi:hypothetical protein
MYTVNYGGGVSDVQLEWTARELDHAEKSDKDVVLIAHHDPRGGHKGHDHGYYYEQIEYRGIGQSALNYLNGSVLLPVLCKLPSWALKDSTESDCLHDGLQDWMRPDPTFDCRAADRQADGTCDPAVVDPASGRSPYFSGLELVEQIATHPRVRTMLLGHTHYHSLEVLAEGAEMVPEGFQLSHEEEERFAALEVANPVRGYAWQGETPEYDPDNLDVEQVASDNAWFFAVQRAAAQKVVRHLQGAKRELAILRLTSNAALTRQKYNDESMIGFSVLHMHRKDDARGYAEAQLNEASYYLNVGSGVFEPIASVGIERTLKMTTDGPTNPVDALFE